jgi:hypothetical protein
MKAVLLFRDGGVAPISNTPLRAISPRWTTLSASVRDVDRIAPHSWTGHARSRAQTSLKGPTDRVNSSTSSQRTPDFTDCVRTGDRGKTSPGLNQCEFGG